MNRINGFLTQWSLARDIGETHYWVEDGCKQCGHCKHSVKGGCMNCNKLRAQKKRDEKGNLINAVRRFKWANDEDYADRQRRNARNHYHNNKKEIRLHRKLKRYALTQEEYITLIENQNGICAIEGCNNEIAGSSRTDNKLFVDHCHKTNKVRGLLCHNCNVMLGHAKDNSKVLKGAAKYLIENEYEFNEV